MVLKNHLIASLAVLLFVQVSFGQEQDAVIRVNSENEFVLGVNGGVIVNRAFSQFEKASESQGHYSSEEIKTLGGEIMKPGFWIGCNGLLKYYRIWIVTGVNAFETQYQYKYISNDYKPYGSARFPNVGQRTSTNIDVYGKALTLNLELGYKRSWTYPISVQHLLILQVVGRRIERLKGNTVQTWATNYPTNFYYSETTPINKKETNSDGTYSSYKLLPCYKFTLFIEGKLKEKTFELMFFRNFALSRKISAPFWGFGLNYPLVLFNNK